MSQDVLGLFDQLQLGADTTLLGHSMGGKVAMRFALDHPERLARLVVVDIAPRLSDMNHQDDIITGLNSLPLASCKAVRRLIRPWPITFPSPMYASFC